MARNFQGIRRRTSCDDVLNNSHILEEILFRLPPEFISKPVLVSKLWFGLICSSSFHEGYTRRWSRALHLVGFKGFYVRSDGFFRTPISQDGGMESYRPDSYDWEYAHRFMSTRNEGDDDDNDNDVAFGQHDYLIDSSPNGILLIGRQSYPFTFIVWNPFTRKHHQLPQPRENYKFGCMAFEVDYSREGGKGSFHYRVTRAKADMIGFALDAVSIQTFSSKTGLWEQTTFPSSPDMKLTALNTGTVIKGVIYWSLANGGVGVYDPSRRGSHHLAYIASPDKGKPLKYAGKCCAESGDGRLQCARTCWADMKIWVLEMEQDGDYSKYEWSLRYNIVFDNVGKKNLSCCQGYKYGHFFWVSFVPRNSEYVFLRLEERIFLLHIASEKLQHIPYEGEASDNLKKRRRRRRRRRKGEASSGDWYNTCSKDVIPYFKWACPWPKPNPNPNPNRV